jgi:hypothetical protein
LDLESTGGPGIEAWSSACGAVGNGGIVRGGRKLDHQVCAFEGDHGTLVSFSLSIWPQTAMVNSLFYHVLPAMMSCLATGPKNNGPIHHEQNKPFLFIKWLSLVLVTVIQCWLPFGNHFKNTILPLSVFGDIYKTMGITSRLGSLKFFSGDSGQELWAQDSSQHPFPTLLSI